MSDTANEVQKNPTALGGTLPLSVAARDRFSQESIDLIFASVAPALNSRATLMRFVEIAARYDLDPFTGEIWLANMGGRNGGAGNMTILVGRDGYMKVAKRDATFVSCTGQPVYEHDEFDAEYVGEDRGWKIRHKPAHPAKRGEPLGAWATLVRKGKPTLYFFASLAQFRKSGGAWQYEDAMIVKCAVSYLLRTTYGVSGPVPADEVQAGFNADAPANGPAGSPAAPDLSALPERVRDLFARAADTDRMSWRLPDVLSRITGPAGVLDAEVRRLEKDLIAWLAENEIRDAQVVDPQDEGPATTFDGEHHDEQPAVVADPEPEVVDAVPAESPEDRWRNDAGWRERVGGALRELWALLGEHGEMPADATDAAQASALIAELEAAGVPRGWSPPMEAAPAVADEHDDAAFVAEPGDEGPGD